MMNDKKSFDPSVEGSRMSTAEFRDFAAALISEEADKDGDFRMFMSELRIISTAINEHDAELSTKVLKIYDTIRDAVEHVKARHGEHDRRP